MEPLTHVLTCREILAPSPVPWEEPAPPSSPRTPDSDRPPTPVPFCTGPLDQLAVEPCVLRPQEVRSRTGPGVSQEDFLQAVIAVLDVMLQGP